MTSQRNNTTFDENDFQGHSSIDELVQTERMERQHPDYAPFIDNGGPHNFDLPNVYYPIRPQTDEQYYGNDE